MSKKILFFLLAGIILLGGAGCGDGLGTPADQNYKDSQAAGQDNQGATDESVGAEETLSSGEEVSINNVDFVAYKNKSMDYLIERPDRWYWRHWNKKEIGETSPGVDDYFITDRIPLPDLGSEYLGCIVIEVSERSIDEVINSASDLVASDAMVGGVEAKKFEGMRDNEIVKNQRVIQYIFEKDGKTFRFAYAKSGSTEEDEAVFEHIVSSFQFEE